MMIFKKAIPRRTVLRGMGATLALPFLDGMIPAFAAADAASGGREALPLLSPKQASATQRRRNCPEGRSISFRSAVSR